MRPYVVDATGRVVARVGSPGAGEEAWLADADAIVAAFNATIGRSAMEAWIRKVVRDELDRSARLFGPAAS
jgi:hypothetical protein